MRRILVLSGLGRRLVLDEYCLGNRLDKVMAHELNRPVMMLVDRVIFDGVAMAGGY